MVPAAPPRSGSFDFLDLTDADAWQQIELQVKRARKRMPSKEHILGFPCTLDNRRVRRMIRDVLKQIEAVRPDDFERLRKLSIGFRRLSRAKWRQRVRGQCCSFHVRVRPQPTGEKGKRKWISERKQLTEPCNRPQYVDLWDGRFDNRRHEELYVCTIAHELGHAATRPRDYRAREGGPIDGGWVSEACAEYYVYRWGFGRIARRARRDMDWRHHGPGPGREFSVSGKGAPERAYRVTRHFYIQAAD